jgi:hypothetical protein
MVDARAGRGARLPLVNIECYSSFHLRISIFGQNNSGHESDTHTRLELGQSDERMSKSMGNNMPTPAEQIIYRCHDNADGE